MYSKFFSPGSILNPSRVVEFGSLVLAVASILAIGKMSEDELDEFTLPSFVMGSSIDYGMNAEIENQIGIPFEFQL